MEDIRHCDAHGYFAAGACPGCGGEGRRVLSGDRRRQLSTFLSGLLRHFPDEFALAVDDRGWSDVDGVVAVVRARYDWADRTAVAGVVAVDPKGRFEVHDGRLRAAYGHSVDVDLGDAAGPVPDRLYHGTAPSTVEAIREEGLRPMSRQLVHLSGTVADAREVGSRHADDPVVLVVDAAGLRAAGHRVTKRGASVYTTERVPPAYVFDASGGDSPRVRRGSRG